MDPLTALGLACNIVSLVEQGIEAAAVCKELYERGSLDDNNNVERYAGGLAAANNDLQAVLKAHGTTRATRLQKIAEDASKAAADLKTELNKLKLSKSTGNRRTGGAFKMTLKTIFKKGTIDKLLKALEKQEAALQSGLLKELYIKAGQDDLTRRKEFQALGQAQRDSIVEILGRLQLVSTDIETSIKATGTTITARLDSHYSAQTSYLQNQERDALRVRLLDALAFPEMNERRNMIEHRVPDFGSTYDWIFQKSARNSSHGGFPRSHQFAQWLRSGKELFWVSGKPGSGKSSLIDYIYQNLHGQGPGVDMLAEWARPNPVQVLTFWFFRPATSVLLKSLQGMWRSLCFQILNQDEKLAETIRSNNDGSAPDSLKSCLARSGSHAQTWTDAELKSWFVYLVTHSEYKYSILVDGLDEAVNHHEALLHDIRCIASISETAKICCSSRPEPAFQRTLCSYPSLRLQDFNHGDIQMYCQERLRRNRAAQFADRITDMSDGVFLWAALVTGDLKNAADQGDSEEELELRLEECPAEMNDLFTFLLEKQDKFYAKHPKPYLAIIHASRKTSFTITALELLIASSGHEQLKEMFRSGLNNSHLAALDSLASNFEVNVVARCGNLVEFSLWDNWDHPRPEFPTQFPYGSLDKMKSMNVGFIHRSAQDFLVESERGVALLQSCGISDQDALKLLMLASTIISTIDASDQSAKRAIGYGSRIQRDFWTSYEIDVAESALADLHAQTPWRVPWKSAEAEDGQQDVYGVPNFLSVLCPQISVHESALFSYAEYYGMDAYLESKLIHLGSNISGVMASFCIIQWIHRGGNAIRMAPLIGLLKKHLSWTQNVTLYYRLGWSYGDVLAFSPSITLPLWQHMYIVLAKSYLDPEPYLLLPDYWHNPFGHIPYPDIENHYIESLIFGNKADIWMCPAPIGSMESVEQNFTPYVDVSSYDIFKVRVKLDGFAAPGRTNLDFCQYSPRGVARFFEIDSSVNQSLQDLLDTRSMPSVYAGCAEVLVRTVNQHLDRLAPAEIGRILSAQYPTRALEYVIYSEGQFRFVGKAGRDAWEEQVRMTRTMYDKGDERDERDEDPGKGSDPDPVLREIMKCVELMERDYRSEPSSSTGEYE